MSDTKINQRPETPSVRMPEEAITPIPEELLEDWDLPELIPEVEAELERLRSSEQVGDSSKDG